MIYLLLAACLFPEVGDVGVWRKLTAALAGVRTATPTAGALAQARRRVGAAPLRWLFDLLRGGADVLMHTSRSHAAIVDAMNGRAIA